MTTQITVQGVISKIDAWVQHHETFVVLSLITRVGKWPDERDYQAHEFKVEWFYPIEMSDYVDALASKINETTTTNPFELLQIAEPIE